MSTLPKLASYQLFYEQLPLKRIRRSKRAASLLKNV